VCVRSSAHADQRLARPGGWPRLLPVASSVVVTVQLAAVLEQRCNTKTVFNTVVLHPTATAMWWVVGWCKGLAGHLVSDTCRVPCGPRYGHTSCTVG
jgi:hypothetical protein